MDFDEYLQMRISQCALLNDLEDITLNLETIEKKLEENIFKIGSIGKREKREELEERIREMEKEEKTMKDTGEEYLKEFREELL